jgi:hypothetical protein
VQRDGTRAYIIEGESHYVRGGEGMIDFEGGPFVCNGACTGGDDPLFVDAVGALPCIGADEVVVEAQWLSRENAAYALGVPTELLDPLRQRSFALVKTRKEGAGHEQ